MSWTYQQSTGRLSRNGALVGACYSGHGEGLNNPAMQDVRGVGPIPQGSYTVGPPKTPIDHLGPLAMPLSPHPDNEMFGRSAIFMHGDNPAMDHTASDGCVVAGPVIRNAVNQARLEGDDLLQVIA
jgi:hypothetical protein